MKDARDIIIKPVVSEKSYDLVERNKYTFRVAMDSTKPDIRRAVEQIFKVRVTDVNTLRVTGKMRRRGRTSGRRPDWKKAIVTLAEGEKIEIFEAAK